jgi:hypothetical protein
LHGLRTVGAHLFVAAIVEEDYVAAADLICDFLFDHGGRRRGPVVAGYVPHYGIEAEFAGDAENGGAACTERRAEEIRVLSDGIFNGGVAGSEFLANFSGAFERQEGMRQGVVANKVSGFRDFAGEVGALLDVAAD